MAHQVLQTHQAAPIQLLMGTLQLAAALPVLSQINPPNPAALVAAAHPMLNPAALELLAKEMLAAQEAQILAEAAVERAQAALPRQWLTAALVGLAHLHQSQDHP